MIRPVLAATTTMVALSLSWGMASSAADEATVQKAPPAAPYKAVSSLVPLPDFIPGMGQLFVNADKHTFLLLAVPIKFRRIFYSTLWEPSS